MQTVQYEKAMNCVSEQKPLIYCLNILNGYVWMNQTVFQRVFGKPVLWNPVYYNWKSLNAVKSNIQMDVFSETGLIYNIRKENYVFNKINEFFLTFPSN